DGDLEAVLAQYEPGAVLQPWAVGAGLGGRSLRDTITDLMALRLPLSATVHTVLVSGDLALVLAGREVARPGPAGGGGRGAGGGAGRVGGYGWGGWVRAGPGVTGTAPGASSRGPGAWASRARPPRSAVSPATDRPRTGAGHGGRHRSAAYTTRPGTRP